MGFTFSNTEVKIIKLFNRLIIYELTITSRPGYYKELIRVFKGFPSKDFKLAEGRYYMAFRFTFSEKGKSRELTNGEVVIKDTMIELIDPEIRQQ